MDFLKYIKEAKEKSKQRKFLQSMEVIFNFKGINFTKQENRFNFTVSLPKGRGKPVSCGVFGEGSFLDQVKKLGKTAISKSDLQKFKEKPKIFKKIVKKCDFFLAQSTLMSIVAKTVGQVLGPKGKMPKPLLPEVDLEKMIKSLENAVTIKSKGKFLPTIQAPFGSIEMSDEDLNANANAIYDKILTEIKGNKTSIKSIYLKASMGPSVKVELSWQKKGEQSK